MIASKWWRQHIVDVNILLMSTSCWRQHFGDFCEQWPKPKQNDGAHINITCIETWCYICDITSSATLEFLPSNVTSSCDIITWRHFRSKIWREHCALVLAYTTTNIIYLINNQECEVIMIMHHFVICNNYCNHRNKSHRIFWSTSLQMYSHS